jgi:hypothetical protein
MGDEMRHTLLNLLAAGLLVLAPTAAAVEMDMVTLEEVDQTGVAALPSGGGEQPYEILWDLTHGVYLSYQPSGYFSTLTGVLATSGFNMNTTSTGVQNEDLTQYDVVVINLSSAWYSPYSSEEVDSLVSFVDQGGGLLVMGANSGCPNGNINPVSQAFGTTCGLSSIEPTDLYFTNFISHQIFEGISTIYYRATGALSCVAPSVEAAWSPTYSEVMVSLLDPSPPRVVILGTATGLSNNYIGNADNIDFGTNVFLFLAGWSIPLERTSWGEIKKLDF